MRVLVLFLALDIVLHITHLLICQWCFCTGSCCCPSCLLRAVIVPVMERVLGPYLRGGGAKAFNFQALSQDLLTTTLEIPFRWVQRAPCVPVCNTGKAHETQ